MKPGLLSRAKVFKVILAQLLIALALVVGWKIYRHYRPAIVPNLSQNADDATVREFKNSNDPVSQRSVISAYIDKGDYESAKTTAANLAAKTNDYQDYLQLLVICGVRNVNNKESCIINADNHLKPLVKNMPFLSAYTAAKLLEQDGHNADAVIFYQRAYDVYAPETGAQGMLTQDQLKTHIDELRK
jgi:hypothetical protein